MNRLMLIGFLLATATAQGSVTIQLGKPTVEQDRITVPVVLGGELGGGVSAMDFRFRYNPEALQPVSVVAGTAAESADKRVMSNQRTPGEYAVVMMGFNQSACGPGEAIRIVLQRLRGPDEKWDLSLSDPTMSSVDGRLIESRVLPSDVEAAEDSEPEEEDAGRSPQVPEVDSGAGELSAVQPPAVYDGSMVGPAADSGSLESMSEEKLTSALQSAQDVRHGIESPGQGSTDEGEGPGRGSPNLNETGLSATVENSGRINTAGLAGSGGVSSRGALQDNKVELQSGANAAELPSEPADRGGVYGPVFAGVFIVFALAAVVFWRRSRLIG